MHPELATPSRVAIYARVSTEDQAERQTIQAQLEFLRRFCELYDLPISGEYKDDGISGATPLSDRTDGQRLLADAADGRFQIVLVYRLDRLGRSLRTLLEAHQALDDHGITIRSATEPFDTSSPIGRFVFQLLASIAELERATITERMTMGRDRVARQGKWTGGAVPFGYELDGEGYLQPSGVLVAETDETEAALVQDLFARIAGGSTLVAECRRLNALGVVPVHRYARGADRVTRATWTVGRVHGIIHNPIFKGVHLLRSRQGIIERPAPALVEADVWERAQVQLTRNRALRPRTGDSKYLLRGLIVCEQCGRHFSGWTQRSRHGKQYWYYRCSTQMAANYSTARERCTAKVLPAGWLEDLVWADCRAFIQQPGEALAEAQAQLRARLSETAKMADRHRALQRELAEKAAERERVATLYRRNRITLEDAEAQLEAVAHDERELRQMLDALDTQALLADAFESHLSEATTMLARLQNRLEEIEKTKDWAAKREVVEMLVARIGVATAGTGKAKQARVLMRYSFGQPRAVVSGTDWRR